MIPRDIVWRDLTWRDLRDRQTQTVPIGAVTDTADFARFQDTKTILSDGNVPVYVALIQILTAYLAYIFGTSTATPVWCAFLWFEYADEKMVLIRNL